MIKKRKSAAVRRRSSAGVPGGNAGGHAGDRMKSAVMDVSRPASRWTFLTNHAHVLILLSRTPDMVLREVAAHVGITERAVQRIIADLEGAGCIEIERVGRRNRYRILDSKALRHPIEAHHTIGDLVRLIIGG
jgi:DNA-binding transcriptional ArsR family regulator